MARIGTLIRLLFLVSILLAPVSASGSRDDTGTEISYVGIPGPFCVRHYCRSISGDSWIVGANEIVYRSNDQPIRKTTIPTSAWNGIFFANSSVGWVVGDNGWIFHTEDAGVTWKSQTSDVSAELNAITCIDEAHCWAVGNTGTIITTSDRGTHWKIVKSGFSKSLYAVSFVDGQTGWTTGEDGFIAHTTNGGVSWKKQQATIVLFPDGPFASPTDLLAAKFADKNRGWVAGAGGIARTLNGGETWEVTDVEGNAFFGLVSHDGITVWAISRSGSNCMTKDAGLTWTQFDPGNEGAKQKSCADAE